MDMFDTLLNNAQTGNTARVKSILSHHHFSQYDWPKLLAMSVAHDTSFQTLLAACPPDLLGNALSEVALTGNTNAFDTLAHRCIAHDDDADGNIGRAGWNCAHLDQAVMLTHILHNHKNYIQPLLDYARAAVSSNALNALDALIAHGLDGFSLHRSLKGAIKEGKMECVERLFPLVDIAYENYDLVHAAVATKNPLLVKTLTQNCEPVVLSQVLDHACKWGGEDLVRHLVSNGANPENNNSRPLIMAALHNHMQIVEALLPLCGSVPDKSRALVAAAVNTNENMVKLLLPHSDVDMVIAQLEQYNVDAAALVRKADAKRVRDLLNATVDGDGRANARRLKI